jgi:hypothetical protein
MATITKARTTRTAADTVAPLIRFLIVSLTVATAAVHAWLGGLLFLANAAGYVTLALGMVLPGPFAAWRWLVRLALLGFTATTMAAWVVFGGRFGIAYLDKGLEALLVALLIAEIWRIDGGPRGIVQKLRELATTARRLVLPGAVR